MNQSHRTIWNGALNAWVAVPETASAKGKSVKSKTSRRSGLATVRLALISTAPLFMAGHVAAACGDASGQYSLFANGGSLCNATQASYTGNNLAYAAEDGSVLTFIQPNVTITSASNNVYVLSSGGVNGGGFSGSAATVHALGNLTVAASAGSGTSRAIYMYAGANAAGERSRLIVDGNLTATRGTGAAAVQNDGGHIEVIGTTTISAVNADAFRNNGLGSNVFHGAVDISVTAVGSTGRGVIMSGGAIDFLGGATIRTTSGNGIDLSGGKIATQQATDIATTGASAIGVAVAGTGDFNSAAGSLVIATQGNAASALQVSGTGKATLGNANVATLGTQARGLAALSGGQIAGTGAVVIDTKGANAQGVLATDGSSVQVGTAKVSTAGVDARGLSARAGGVVTVDGLADISTTGQRAHAVLAGDTGAGIVGTVRLGSVRTNTTGLAGHGLYAINAGSRIEVTGDAALTAGGPSSIGIVVELGGVVVVGGATTIDHVSAGGVGIFATGSASKVSLQALDLQTVNPGRGGVYVTDGAAVTATRMDVRTLGASADGIIAQSGGTVTVSGPLNVTVSGSSTGVCNGGVAICLVGDKAAVSGGSTVVASAIQSTGTAVRLETGADMVATLTNATLTTTGASSDLISVSQATGSSALNLKNSTAMASTGGLLLNVAAGSTFAFDNDQTTLVGDIKASADSTVNMALRNGSRLTGKIDPVNLSVDATSRWDMTGDSMLANLSNAGTINVLPGAGGLAGVYKTLTATNYVGNGGRINLNTYLGDDSSPSDKLIVNGGSATGSTRLGITNAGGSGAQTTGNGILVVDAQNGATTATGAFALAGAVSAGAYDYSLVRRGNESWYLTSQLPTPPIEPETPVVPGMPATPAASLPNYRQETSLYAAVPSLAMLHSAATMDSFHERVGAAGPSAGNGDQPSRLWVRLLGSSGERKGDALGVYGRTGPAFDHKTYAMQLGGDLYRGANAGGSQTAAGVYLGTGQTTGDVTHFNGQAAGSAKLDVTSLGMYWTLMGASGGYVDFVAQGSRYGVTATSTRMPSVKTSGSGYDVSVEGGLPFQLSGAWTLEPQLQLRLLSVDLGNGQDIAGCVNYGDVDSLVGRAGVKLAYKASGLTAWARVDLLNEFKGRSSTNVASLWGTNGVDFSSSLHGASLALTAGVDTKLTDTVSLYGSASYRRAMGGNRGHAWGAQAGVKVAW